MGVKRVARMGHEREKLKNKVDSSKEVSLGDDFSPNNDKEKNKTTRPEDVEISASEIGADVNVNNYEIEKEKEKKKKKEEEEKKGKLEQNNVDLISVKGGKQDNAVVGEKVSEIEVDLKDDQTRVGVNMGLQESSVGKNRKKNHKEKKGRGKTDSTSSVISVLENNLRESVDEGQKLSGSEDVSEMKNGEDKDQKKKKKKSLKQKMCEGGNDLVITGVTDSEVVESERCSHDKNIMNDVEAPQKERKKKKQRSNVDLETTSPKLMAEVSVNKCNAIEKEGGNIDSISKDEKEKKRKKRKREEGKDEGVEATSLLENTTPKGISKRVSFSEKVEVFPSSEGPSDEGSVQEDKLVRGKRFSPEEDEKVKEAVLNYIADHGLGEEGLKMVLQCKKYPEIKNCWKEIGAALPWRPSESIYYRAHILFERDEKRSWSEEEYELVRKFYEKYGADWKTLADALGKHRFHVKDAWRRIKLTDLKRGLWSQEEYQNLFDLVNMDLRMKAFEERKSSKHGMLRDNISWTAISDKLGTRTTPVCCMKWYNQLTSPMVAEGKWLDVDDYHLLIALYELDACCMEDVDWDCLLEHRPGDVCRRRWNQMVKHLGEHGNTSFADQVEVLIQRYCPDVLEAREAYNSKPVVP